MDPRIRTRTCIRARNRSPRELPSQTRPSLKSSLVFYFFSWTHHLFLVCSSQIHFTKLLKTRSHHHPSPFPFLYPPFHFHCKTPCGQGPDHPNTLRDFVAKHESSVPLTLQSLPDPTELGCEHFPSALHLPKQASNPR